MGHVHNRGRTGWGPVLWYQLSAEVGDTHALWRVGNLLEQTARKDERTKLWRYGWSPDGTIMDPWEAPAL